MLLGLRYEFNPAPPPPPAGPPAEPAPAPAPSRTYLVFFDWDQSTLGDRARQIIAEAAQSSTRVQTTRLEVNGYTDTSAAHPGERGEAYNQALSVRRATAVRSELVRDGVPQNRRSRSMATARLTRWCRPVRTPASRRTGASKSSCSEAPGRVRCLPDTTAVD